jgi:hypothetical protein
MRPGKGEWGANGWMSLFVVVVQFGAVSGREFVMTKYSAPATASW